jgi:glycosyltransferase involved in cell wall biosynthesis
MEQMLDNATDFTPAAGDNTDAQTTGVGFIMEQTLGHVTHHRNLSRWVEEAGDIRAEWIPVPFEADDRWERMPGVRSNWSIRASLRARDGVRRTLRKRSLDALFYHTQTTALFAAPFMRRIPTVVSLDATPINYDQVGAEYGHNTGNNGWLEARKYSWSRQTFLSAAALVSWCRWARDSLVEDYGVPADRIFVIPPGVDLERWTFEREQRQGEPARPLRLLFVGGDFERKGGRELLCAFRSGLSAGSELDVVTRDEAVAAELSGTDGLRVHTGLTPNSDALRELYARADLFVFPTRGDCLPIAVMEAMAAGLPVITTGVGALREEVEEGVNGLVVPAGDAGALAEAVRALARDPERRLAMGRAGRDMAAERFDGRQNYNRVIELVRVCAGSRAALRAGRPAAP